MQDASIASIDSAIWALVLIARFHQIATDPAQLKHQYSDNGQLLSERELLQAALQMVIQLNPTPYK